MAQEFALTMRDSLQRGLRPDARMHKNAFFMDELINAKPTKFGLLPYEPVVVPFSPAVLSGYALEQEWPNPIMYKGKGRTFLFDSTRVFYVNENSFDLYAIPIYDFANQDTLATPPIGAPWQIMDAFDVWFATNGQCTVFTANHQQMLGNALKTYVTTQSTFETGTEHRGRFVIGGFDPTNFFSSSWETMLSNDAFTVATGIDSNTSIQLGENWVLWSSIGGGDFPLWLFDHDFAENSFTNTGSFYSSTRPVFYDKNRQMTWGFMPMQWQGKVRVVKTLGKNVIVYGDNGISVLFPVGEPIPTYGYQTLQHFGIHAHAVGGDDNEHVFITQRGEMWRLSANLEFTRLGYREYMHPMLSAEIAISTNFNVDDREYYICDGTESYVLTEQGLAQTTQIVNSTINHGEFTMGMGSLPDYINDQRCHLMTDWTDFQDGTRQKMIGWIEVIGDIKSGVVAKVAVEYRYEKHENAKRSRFVKLNDEGAAYIGISGNAFRIIVETDNYTNTSIDYVTIRWQRNDRRWTRSGSANASLA